MRGALPVGDGTALLLRRPDIREAERRLAAATVRIGVSRADLYPRVKAYRPAIEAGRHTLDVMIDHGLVMPGDRRLLQRMLTNLLDNAILHTPPGTLVRVALKWPDGAIQLCVSDDGPGVGAHEAAGLFHRFARADRSRSNAGHGLGLAMVAAVVGAHGGTATIAPRPGFGVFIEFRP